MKNKYHITRCVETPEEQLDKDYVIQTYTRNYTNFTHGENAKLFDENEIKTALIEVLN